MAEDELLGIFDASPQLERLSLVRVGQTILVDGNQQLPPKRIAPLPALVFLKLDSDPEVVGYILAHLDIPALASLEIRSHPSASDFARSLNHFFPDDRLPRRIFSEPPLFEVWRPFGETSSLGFSIGSFKVQFDFDPDDAEASRNATAACGLLVPPSITTLKLEFSGLQVQEWRQFFRSHPEVRWVECTGTWAEPVSESLWDALSPKGDDDQAIICPRLESIVFETHSAPVEFMRLVDCLWCRGDAGFKLRHLKIVDFGQWAYKIAGLTHPLVTIIEVDPPKELMPNVGPILMDGPGIR